MSGIKSIVIQKNTIHANPHGNSGSFRFIDAKQTSGTQLLKQRGFPGIFNIHFIILTFFPENAQLLDVPLFAFTMPPNTCICLQQFFCVLSSFHFESHYPKCSIKVHFPSKSVFKNGRSRCCLGAVSKEKKYLVKFTNQADKWSTQYPFLKQSTCGLIDLCSLQNMQY